MSKFKKRITKIAVNLNNALVYGTAFGKLQEILDLFDTVFVVDKTPDKIRAKNIVYIPDLKDFRETISISMIFIDKNKIDDLSELIPIFSQGKAVVLIQGNEVIGRDKSTLLYKYHFNATSQQKNFHVWTQIK